MPIDTYTSQITLERCNLRTENDRQKIQIKALSKDIEKYKIELNIMKILSALIQE